MRPTDRSGMHRKRIVRVDGFRWDDLLRYLCCLLFMACLSRSHDPTHFDGGFEQEETK
jgi:hypothetical protein